MRSRRLLSRSSRLAPFAFTLVLPIVAIWILIASKGMSTAPCGWPDPPYEGAIPPLLILAACSLSFVLGHLFTYLRDDDDEPIERARRLPRQHLDQDDLLKHQTLRSLQGSVIMLVFVCVFLGTVFVLLVYETVSLIQFPRLWPITYYVRCANVVAPWWTLGAACVVSALAGYWFWHRGTPKR